MKREKCLDEEIRALACQEREVLCELLPKLVELDRTQGFLDLGFSNLFEYLTEGVRYSGGSAQRRIDAARLLVEVPELCSKLESGALNLNQITLVKRAVRQVLRERPVAAEEKELVLCKIEGRTQRDSEVIVAKFFQLPVLEGATQTAQANESVRMEITLSKTLFAKIREAQQLLSHRIPTNDFVEYLDYVTSKVIEKKVKAGRPTATVAVTPKLRREILAQQPCCQYRNSRTGTICGSKWQLQVDHIIGVWAGGDNRRQNLQALCGKHNRLKYRKEVGLILREPCAGYSAGVRT